MTFTVGIAGITGKNASKLLAGLRDSARAVVVQGSWDDLKALRDFVRGCDVVVCCYLGDNTLMTDGQKLLIDACELEKVNRYLASDYCPDFMKLEYGQHPVKDPMKHVKAHLDSKKHVNDVHVLVGAFMETFWSVHFGVWNAEKCKLSFYGSGDEIWESTTYGTAAEYVSAVARDPHATGLQHFLGDRSSIREIANDFAQVYGKTPQLKCLGSLDDLYSTMQATFKKDPSNIYAYLALFAQFYCTNGQTYLKPELDNSKYPEVTPVTFKTFLQNHKMEELSDAYQKAGSSV